MQYSLLTTAVAAAAAEGGPSTPIMPHTPELIWGLLMFGVIFLIVWKFAWPQLESIVAARADAIEGGMERAAKAEAEAAAAKKQYDDQLGEARSEAARIREHAKEQGAQIIAEMRTQAATEASRITETAHKQIEAERQQAMVQLRGEVGQISTDLASKIVGESLQDEVRQRGIVDRFLADLSEGAIQPEKLGASAEQGL